MTRAPRVWAEIDLAAIAANVGSIARLVTPARVMAVVKANAYGHGAEPVARAAVRAGATWLATATVSEGLDLRGAGITAPILILGPARDEEEPAVAAGLSLAVVDVAGVRAADAAAARTGREARVHLKVETGMGRLGVPAEALGEINDVLERATHVIVEGVFTHLAAAASDFAYSREQLHRFDAALQTIQARFPGAVRHAAGSAGLLALPESRLDLVRPGLALYGLPPAPHLADRLPLRPAMSLWARVVQVRDLPAGATVSYGRTFRATRPTRIATVAVGYADGYPWALGNRGEMVIEGRTYSVAGRICMDYTMLDVTDGAVEPGAVAQVIGPQMPADAVAAKAETIAYELLSRVGPRVDRIYSSTGRGAH